MSDLVPLSTLSAALDEIYQLRRLLAYEACIVNATLQYATLPKGRRAVMKQQVERMRQAARGEVTSALAGRSSEVYRRALRESGAKETLTRFEWEERLP